MPSRGPDRQLGFSCEDVLPPLWTGFPQAVAIQSKQLTFDHLRNYCVKVTTLLTDRSFSPTLSAHPYIRVVYKVKEIPCSYAVDILYKCVEIIRRRGPSLKYSSGNYQTDISLARIDGAILNNLQEDHSVSDYEKLTAAKPEKRYKLIISGEVSPP